METLILTQADVRDLVRMDAVVPAVERAFLAHGRGEARMPAKVYLDLPEHGGDFRAMPAYMDGSAGIKWVNSHTHNPERHGLPTVMAVYILNDPATALPLAIMDATLITALRTGAAGAVASRYLAREDARTLGLIGCGVQARVLWEAHRVTHPELEVLTADRDPAAAERLAEAIGGRAVSVQEAARCDIVCTATPTRSPFLTRADLSDGAHVNAMGADAEGKQELDADVLNAARVVIDDWAQATHSGEINVPLHEGTYWREAIHGTLGEIAVGTLEGRGDANLTVFDSTGLAIQDVAVARVVYEAARERGVGVGVDLVGAGGKV